MESLTLHFGQNRGAISIEEYGKKYDRIFGKKKKKKLVGMATQDQKTQAFKLLMRLAFAEEDFERYRMNIVGASAYSLDGIISHMKNLLEKRDE